jgi:large subunit ribosomal protein L22
LKDIAMHKAIETKNTEFRAEARFQRCSPQKAKLVLDLIKGLRVEKAINTVAFTNKRIAPVVEKVLRSTSTSITCTSRPRSRTRDRG